MDDQEFSNCSNCNQNTVEATAGVVCDSFPAAYPTKCKTCGWVGLSEKTAERRLFNASLQKGTDAEHEY